MVVFGFEDLAVGAFADRFDHCVYLVELVLGYFGELFLFLVVALKHVGFCLILSIK